MLLATLLGGALGAAGMVLLRQWWGGDLAATTGYHSVAMSASPRALAPVAAGRAFGMSPEHMRRPDALAASTTVG